MLCLKYVPLLFDPLPLGVLLLTLLSVLLRSVVFFILTLSTVRNFTCDTAQTNPVLQRDLAVHKDYSTLVR